MRPALWRELLWLQTGCAYPDGPHEVAPCHVERVKSLGYFGNAGPVGRLLVIGPGRVTELDALKATLEPSSITVLTALDAEQRNIAGYNVVVGDMHDCDLPTAGYDAVYSSNVLEHAISPLAALLEMRRLLRPGGRYCVIVPTFHTSSGGYGPYHISCLATEQWAELFRKTGLPVTFATQLDEVPFAEQEQFLHFYGAAGPLPAPYDQLFERMWMARGES
jgi:SAM-dependent methyltransferase